MVVVDVGFLVFSFFSFVCLFLCLFGDLCVAVVVVLGFLLGGWGRGVLGLVCFLFFFLPFSFSSLYCCFSMVFALT